MKKVLLLLLLLTTELSFAAKVHNCSMESKLPFLIEGCQGEFCEEVMFDKAIGKLLIYARPDIKSKIIKTVKKCEELPDFEPVVLIKKLRTVEVEIANKAQRERGINVGDQIKLVLFVGGEGHAHLCLGENVKFGADTFVDKNNKNPEYLSVGFIKNYKIKKDPFNLQEYNFNEYFEEWIKFTKKGRLVGFAPRSKRTMLWYPGVAKNKFKKICNSLNKK